MTRGERDITPRCVKSSSQRRALIARACIYTTSCPGMLTHPLACGGKTRDISLLASNPSLAYTDRPDGEACNIAFVQPCAASSCTHACVSAAAIPWQRAFGSTYTPQMYPYFLHSTQFRTGR